MRQVTVILEPALLWLAAGLLGRDSRLRGFEWPR
ncbi:hypothetical protein PC116_g27266 [Phytophthora cactorum]|nr:hypothetical protein PC114_g19597 [Phytophthora cactorum]KAG4038381.1 hypothetical protein PC123_g26055 [Phytophthora cactorum]KAG4224278.1 hypothetical protein PC116_g27266 [Phytophthora cactorum]